MDQSTNEIIALMRQAVEAEMGFTLRSHLRRGDTDLPNYIAGKKHGLSSLRIVRDVHSVLPQV